MAAACFVALPFIQSQAGSDIQQRAEYRTGAAAAAAEFDSYLQGQKVNHSIDVADGKDLAQRPVTVKIFGDFGGSRQDAICTAMAATAKRTGAEASTVQFFALDQAPVTVNFQASRLPSGNGEVSVSRTSGAPTYRLLRTVRL